MRRMIAAIIWILLIAVSPWSKSAVSAEMNDREIDKPEKTWRTKDGAFHELLKMRKVWGPEYAEQRKNREAALSQGWRQALWMSQPTANMFNYDVNYYKINITLNFSYQTIQSEVLIAGKSLVANLTFIDLTLLSGFAITSVKVNNVTALYLNSGDLFTVYLPAPLSNGQSFKIEINYQGVPQFTGQPLYDIGGGLTYRAAYTSQICQTECEPFGARNWFPCKDYPFDKADSVDLYVTHPSAMTTCANGLLQSITDNGNGTKTTHWSTHYPITTYLIFFSTAYQILHEQHWVYAPGDTMPVVVYAYDGYPEALNNYLAYTIPGLNVFSNLFGLYPFVNEKYGNCLYDSWGMENQTMTALIPSLANEWTIIHELSHQWWGDLITCRDFHHIWLNEGFGTYSEALYYEYYNNLDYYHDYIQNQACLDQPSVYVEDLDNDDIFNGYTTYNKGSRVLHMLRHVVGDSNLFQILKNYQSDPALRYKDAVTQDFQAHCEAVYGHPLNWFFNRWIYQDGNPHYEFAYFNIYDSGLAQNKMILKIKQVQTEYPLFRMPLDVQVFMGALDSIYVVQDSLANQGFVLNLPAPADSVKLDPDQWVLSTVAQVGDVGIVSLTNSIHTIHIGEYFYLKLEAFGKTSPYNWQKISGQLPYGISLINDDSSYLSGTPNYAAVYNFRMRVADSSEPPEADTVPFQITILPPPSNCGDANNDGTANVSDAVYIINYVFAGGNPPDPMGSGDANCDAAVNVSDAVWIINYVFAGGHAPCDTNGDGLLDC